MPKLSCIMSNYNTDPAYLQKAIESVLNQTFRDFELIIVDDCSTDMRSKKLIETLSVKDSRIKPVYNNVNMGLAASLNRAIAFSRGNMSFGLIQMIFASGIGLNSNINI